MTNHLFALYPGIHIDLFQSTLNLCNTYKSEPNLFNVNGNGNGRTEYRKEFKEKQYIGKLPALKRPPNLKVDACKLIKKKI